MPQNCCCRHSCLQLKPIFLSGFTFHRRHRRSSPCPTSNASDRSVRVSGAALKRERGSSGGSGDKHGGRDNTNEQWKPNPSRAARSEPFCCKQDGAARKNVRPISGNVLHPERLFLSLLLLHIINQKKIIYVTIMNRCQQRRKNNTIEPLNYFSRQN